MNAKDAHSASYRDPSGYVYEDQGEIKRIINPIYFEQYKALTESGFFQNLIDKRLLIPHEEISRDNSSIILKSKRIPFISYPYEWSFNMYKEAALLTLRLQKYALNHGFTLKDASAFNITFYEGRAIFIDTLSFDFYKENSPWRAYKQFITHFFGPLLLAHYYGAQQLRLIASFIDGIPVKQLSSLLPFKTKLHPLLYSNIHLLAKSEAKHSEDYSGEPKQASLSKKGQINIITSLYNYIKKLELKEMSEWGNYYHKTNYSDSAFLEKSTIINSWVDAIKPKTIIDIGGNDGTFVRKIKATIPLAIVSDIDNNAVDENYNIMKRNKETSMLPLTLDVLSPSPALGLNNEERESFLDRIKVLAPDVTLALAVIHHMSLSGNVPFKRSAAFFAHFSNHLIIEFPKRQDSWVQRLLDNKLEFKPHFEFYNLTNFIDQFSEFFEVIEQRKIEGSERVLFLMKNKQPVPNRML